MSKPLIDRSFIYNFLPQEPGWFSNIGHHRARARFRKKLRGQYSKEALAGCPLCGGTTFTTIATKERHGLPISMKLCDGCGLGFNSPRLNGKALQDHYARDYREIERGILPNIHEFMFALQYGKGEAVWSMLKPLLEQHDGSPRVAEIGCGEGGLLAWLKENVRGVSVTGFELNQAAVAYGRAQGLNITSDDISPSDRYGAIIIEQVLEHISDLHAFIGALAVTQQPGGLLYVGVPGILRVREGYQSNFISYLEYGHLFHFCLHTLERMLVQYDYRLVEGDETIRAVFVKVGPAVAPSLKSSNVSPAHIKKYIQDLEREFRKNNRHIMSRWRSYLGYLKTYVQSIIKAEASPPS